MCICELCMMCHLYSRLCYFNKLKQTSFISFYWCHSSINTVPEAQAFLILQLGVLSVPPKLVLVLKVRICKPWFLLQSSNCEDRAVSPHILEASGMGILGWVFVRWRHRFSLHVLLSQSRARKGFFLQTHLCSTSHLLTLKSLALSVPHPSPISGTKPVKQKLYCWRGGNSPNLAEKETWVVLPFSYSVSPCMHCFFLEGHQIWGELLCLQ